VQIRVLVVGFDHECCGGDISANDIVTWTLYFRPTVDPVYVKVNHEQLQPGTEVTGRIVEIGEPSTDGGDFIVTLDVGGNEALPDIPAVAVSEE
jgi:hypothetical protein